MMTSYRFSVLLITHLKTRRPHISATCVLIILKHMYRTSNNKQQQHKQEEEEEEEEHRCYYHAMIDNVIR